MKSRTHARTRARRAREAAYRASVIEAAERLFAAHGIDATKVEEIAAEAGLSVATLYTAFGGGKAEIVGGIHRARLAALVAFATDAQASRAPADACLRAALAGSVGFLMSHADYLRMHLREGHAWGLPEAVAARTREGAEGFAEGVGALMAIVERGVAECAFAVDDPRRTARTLVMLQQIHLADWLDRGEVDDPARVFDRYWADVERLLAPAGT